MEPLSILVIASTAISLVSQTSNLYRSFSRLVTGDADPQLKSARARLYTERTRLGRWVDYVQSIDPSKLEDHLGEEEKKTLRSLMKDAEDMVRAASIEFARIDTEGETRTSHRMKKTWLWSFGGYQQNISALLDAMHHLNNALDGLIRPPPMYDAFSMSMKSQAAQPVQSMGPVLAQPVVTPNDTRVASPGEPAVTTTSPRPLILAAIHSMCLRGLDKLETHCGATFSSEPLGAQLIRWGEILEGPLGLDYITEVMDDGQCAYSALRDIVIVTLIDILLIEECILSELVSRSPSNTDLSTGLIKVTASLGMEGVAETALERQAPVADFQDQQEMLKMGSDELKRAVDDLYLLLPTIRSLRRGTLLDRERIANATQIQAAETTQTLIDSVLDVAAIYTSSEALGSLIDETHQKMVQKTIEAFKESDMRQGKKLSPKAQAQIERIVESFADKQSITKQREDEEEHLDRKQKLDATERGAEFSFKFRELYGELRGHENDPTYGEGI